MASQTVPADKRYRISLLLDAYSELLTEKQLTFLRHYFEEDLSFGEIAKEYGVSRQAIFDSVKHGEESLENFERVLKLVENGWARWVAAGRSADGVIERLESIRACLGAGSFTGGKAAEGVAELDRLLAELRGEVSEELEETDEALSEESHEELAPLAETAAPALGGNGSTHV